MPDRISEYMSDRLSEYIEFMSNHTSWNVMVVVIWHDPYGDTKSGHTNDLQCGPLIVQASNWAVSHSSSNRAIASPINSWNGNGTSLYDFGILYWKIPFTRYSPFSWFFRSIYPYNPNIPYITIHIPAISPPWFPLCFPKKRDTVGKSSPSEAWPPSWLPWRIRLSGSPWPSPSPFTTSPKARRDRVVWWLGSGMVWSTHIYIYIDMYLYTYIYIYICTCIYIYIFIFTYAHAYIYIFVYAYTYTYLYIYIFTYSHLQIHIVYIYMYAYIHIFKFTYTYTYTNTYIYIYIHIFTYTYT